MLKKLLVAFFTVFTFGFYAFNQQSKSTNTLEAPPPTINATAATATKQLVGVPRGQYADGEYEGNTADAFYGFIKVGAVIINGKIADIEFLDFPRDHDTSLQISNNAMPILKQEAIWAQGAEVDIVSGATETSLAFRESLAAALTKAKH